MFLEEIQKKHKNNESQIGLLNMYFGGVGDKATLVNDERVVPDHCLNVAVFVQLAPFLRALGKLGPDLILESGWQDRFTHLNPKPHRFLAAENMEAIKELDERFGRDFTDNLAVKIYLYHKAQPRTYVFSKQAYKFFCTLTDQENARYNAQFESEGKITSILNRREVFKGTLLYIMFCEDLFL